MLQNRLDGRGVQDRSLDETLQVGHLKDLKLTSQCVSQQPHGAVAQHHPHLRGRVYSLLV